MAVSSFGESWQWRPNNRVELLENGDEFFPRLLANIARARREVLLETFILFEDEVGRNLQQALIAAAERGVEVGLTVDGYGSFYLSDDFVLALTRAGVQVQVFDPAPRRLGMRTNLFRRLHRKLAVIDGETAYVGGINFSRVHLIDSGPDAAQDYAVELRGPIVADLQQLARQGLQSRSNRPAGQPPQARSATADRALTRLVLRDNQRHRRDIEEAYLVAIRAAREEIIIANAYFFPGYRLLREIAAAARRGVEVSLVLQGDPDMPIAQKGARMLYGYLLEAGVNIYEYCERPLHSKVATIDGRWATVGSSNLDPLSLSLNLEANVLILDRQFSLLLRRRLRQLFQGCQRIDHTALPPHTLWRALTSALVFHFLRHFPAWAGWLPAHTPIIQSQALETSEAAPLQREA